MVGYGSPQEREENYAEWKKKWLGSLMESDHMQQMSEVQEKAVGNASEVQVWHLGSKKLKDVMTCADSPKLAQWC